ncbi:diguanylate cyclase [Microvirga sp. G4-2]|uniref:diguanylate cyclase n=1 Tax=Microvirga sp. G4-2 TaxID=3434467 RepID=UPI0040440A74
MPIRNRMWSQWPGAKLALRLIRSGLHLHIVAAVIAASIFALSGTVLWQARQDTWHEAEEASHNLLTAVARDISTNMELLDLALKGVVQGLAYPGLAQLPPELRHLILFDRVATTTYLGSILVLDESGKVVADAASVKPRTGDFADRDYFSVHRERTDAGLYVSRPYKSRFRNGDISIAISRRLAHPDGRFAGVVIGALSLSHIEQAFKSLKLGRDSAVSLFRSDGVLLTREPLIGPELGQDLSASANVQRFLREPSGSFVGTSAVDNVERLFTFKALDNLPVVFTLNRAVDDIFDEWQDRALVLGLITALLCCAVVALAALFQRELRRRTAAEDELARLATTDGLTGLPNRRAFDEAFEREWSQAARSGHALSLLFVDVDFFKRYNDRYGHGEGDRVLRAVAEAISGSLKRPDDFGARYGGEEFTLLLPATDRAGAEAMAEAIRAAVMALGLAHEDSPHRVVTVSVGVAGAVPRPGQRSQSLLQSADTALYRAKAAGRNMLQAA